MAVKNERIIELEKALQVIYDTLDDDELISGTFETRI